MSRSPAAHGMREHQESIERRFVRARAELARARQALAIAKMGGFGLEYAHALQAAREAEEQLRLLRIELAILGVPMPDAP